MCKRTSYPTGTLAERGDSCLSGHHAHVWRAVYASFAGMQPLVVGRYRGCGSVAQFGVDLFQVDFCHGHFVAGILEIVFEEVEIAFVDFIDQMHRQVVEIGLDRVGAFGAVAFGFVEAGNRLEVDLVPGLDRAQHLAHAVIEFFGPENLVVAATVDDECRDMARHGGPVNIRLHRAFPADGVAGKEQESPKALDLVEVLLTVVAPHLDPVFLDDGRHQLAAIAAAVALDAADLVKERGQDAGIGIAHAGKGVGGVGFHIGVD